MTSRIIATKVYRPESVSIADRETPSDQATLRAWWNWGTSLNVAGNSDAEKIGNRRLLRDGAFTVQVQGRRGHYLLTAYAEAAR